VIDFATVSLQGEPGIPAFNSARARVIWNDGLLRVFTVTGLVLELKTSEPVRLKGLLRSWLVESDVGSIVMRAKCMTCGGPPWWRLLRIPMEELWVTYSDQP
jgi:hypothetical protein